MCSACISRLKSPPFCGIMVLSAWERVRSLGPIWRRRPGGVPILAPPGLTITREPMTLKSKILEALKSIASDQLDETAITVDPVTRHTIVDTTFFLNDEIDLDQLADLLADAVTVKVDPAEPKAGDA